LKPTMAKRKEDLADLRKQQILDAALTVFYKKGFTQSTIADIAETAGVAVGTIYNYYKNKQDLLVSLVTDHIAVSSVVESFSNLLEHPPGPGDTASLSPIFKERLDIGFKNVDRMAMLMGEIHRDRKLRQLFYEQVLGPILKLLERYLESSISNGAARPLNPALVARTMAGMFIGLTLLYKIEGKKGHLHNTSTQKLSLEISRFVLEGIRSK